MAAYFIPILLHPQITHIMEKRFNVFNQIHKGLRCMMYDTSLQLQQADFTTDSANGTIAQLEQLLHIFDEHAHHEDTYILPHVAQHAPHLVESFEKDHITDHKLSADLREHIAEWKNAGNATAKATAGNHIFYAFNDFIAFNLYHMNREESELLYTLWQHNSDAQIMDMQQQIIQSIPPDVLAIESVWMIRAISNAEITAWLQGVKATAPAPVYEGLVQVAKTELPAERWNLINEKINTPATVA